MVSMASDSLLRAAGTSDERPSQPPRGAVVEIVIPVRNEERDLGPSVRRLHAYLRDRFPFAARITIADNGSNDGTWAVASALEAEFSSVRAVRIEQPGRGGALRSVWLASDADIYAYMDVDLSTDLNALLPLLAPLVSGHSDVAIGTRLARGAQVVRGPAGRSSRAATTCCCTRRWAPGSRMPSAASRRSGRTRRGPCSR